MKDKLQLDLLRKAVQEWSGSDGPIALRAAGTGKFNSTFFVEGEGLGQPLVLRVAPPEDRRRMLFYEHRMMLQEPGLHQLLRAKTSMPAPEILHFEERSPLLRRDFLIMERMPGEPMAWANDKLMMELGRKLREVHETVRAESGRYGYLGEHKPMEPQPTWDAAFAVMWNSLLDDVENCRGAESDELDSWRRLLEDHASAFEHFGEDAPLLHMDVWAENILTDGGGRLTALVDWDRALWGDPEIEYAVLEYCGIDMPSFWDGYGRERPSGRDAQVRRIFYLAYEVLKYIVIRIARQGDHPGAKRYHSMGRELLGQL